MVTSVVVGAAFDWAGCVGSAAGWAGGAAGTGCRRAAGFVVLAGALLVFSGTVMPANVAVDSGDSTSGSRNRSPVAVTWIIRLGDVQVVRDLESLDERLELEPQPAPRTNDDRQANTAPARMMDEHFFISVSMVQPMDDHGCSLSASQLYHIPQRNATVQLQFRRRKPVAAEADPNPAAEHRCAFAGASMLAGNDPRRKGVGVCRRIWGRTGICYSRTTML